MRRDGSGVLPLARYLHSLGIVYESTVDNSNTQGHTPNHKAAWGGNLPLIQYFRDELKSTTQSRMVLEILLLTLQKCEAIWIVISGCWSMGAEIEPRVIECWDWMWALI